MYGTLTGIGLALLPLLAILAWAGGAKAFRLVYAGSAGQLARRSRKLIAWAAYAAITSWAVAAVTLMLSLSAARAPVIWIGQLALQVPLAVLPTAVLWFVAVPRLRKLRLKAKGLDGALPCEVRAEAANPGIVLPFQAAALGALTAFYYALEPPVPFRFMDAIMPLLAYGGALGLLYVRHLRRWRKVSVLAVPLRYNAGGRFGRFAGKQAS